jgi:protein-S-isoprenylcysteine O-methyltransferase Ste14
MILKSISDTEFHSFAFLFSNMIAAICTLIIIIAILIDFIFYHKPNTSKNKINSWVETGSMFLYFMLYYLLMRIKAGRLTVSSELFQYIFFAFGNFLIVFGCYINVKARFLLKHNWANQVVIYHNQTLINKGIYKYIRHPLYASLIWMLTGGSLIYFSFLSFFSVYFIFVPMMIYRAKQEELLLAEEFKDYSHYKSKTGMFFPKIFYK